MTNKIRILVADDHAVVRQGIRTMLEPKNEFELVGEAINGKDVINKCVKLKPNLVIMDLLMPMMGGIKAIEEIRHKNIKTQILVLTSYPEEEKVISALKAGANGYILKDSSPAELVQAIHATIRGEMYIYPNLAPRVLEKLIHPEWESPGVLKLTKKEIEVIRLVAKGMSNIEIAHDLIINESTVRFHMNNILSKLGLENRTQVALFALRKGISPLHDNSQDSNLDK